MKGIKYCILSLLTFIVFSFTVSADTCSYKEQTILNSDLSNIKIIYEILNQNKINIIIYNITNNLMIEYTNPETEESITISYSDTNNGKYIIERNANSVEEYQFQIRSNISACYGNVLSTKKIIKPKYNSFSKLSICSDSNLKNHSYCQEFITQDINKSREEVETTLKEYLQVKVKNQTTKAIEKTNYFDAKHIIAYSAGLLILTAIIVIILLIKKKRSEL